MATILSDAFDFIIQMGFLNIVVPFILFYAIVFGMLERTQIFSADKSKKDEKTTNLHSLIAFAIAITATAASNAVGITQNYLPILAVASVVLLGIMMLLGMAFGDKFEEIQQSKVYKNLVWGFAGMLIIGALIVITYFSGLLVTPCIAGDGLTRVNTLNTAQGQCTQLMDMSGFPSQVYVLGLDMAGFMSSETFVGIVGIAIFIGVVLVVMNLVRKE